MSLSVLREMQCEILRQINMLIAFSEQGETGEAFATARKALALTIRDYHAHKDQFVIMPLRQSDHPAHRAMARRCVEKDLHGRQIDMEHYRKWTLDAIRKCPRDYRMAVRLLLRMVDRHIAYQEQIVYPILREATLAANPDSQTRAA